jgi:choline kinase
MKAVIIAAGNSSRLWQKTNKTPKTLLPYQNGTILSTIMNNIAEAGIDEFVFILGYKSEYITNYLNENHSFGYQTDIILNPEFQRGNGLSVLLANEIITDEPFILSMSDHVVTPSAIQRIINDPRDKNLLLIDKRINDIFDIDDATKVWTNGNHIEKINKNLTEYNGIDCGIFRLTPRFFEAMRFQEKNGKESISAGVEVLIQNNDMEACFMNPKETWIDIDTPDAYHYAVDQFNKKISI